MGVIPCVRSVALACSALLAIAEVLAQGGMITVSSQDYFARVGMRCIGKSKRNQSCTFLALGARMKRTAIGSLLGRGLQGGAFPPVVPVSRDSP